MNFDSILEAVQGPALVKLALAALSGVFFLLLRRKETEGVLTRLAVFTAYLLVRDIVYIFLPSDDLYRASDLLVFCGLAYVGLMPKGGFPMVASLLATVSAVVLILVKDLLGLAPNFPTELLRYLSLVPILTLAFSTRGQEDDATPARRLVFSQRYLLAGFSLLYLVLGTVAGPGSLAFQGLVVPLAYVYLAWFAFTFQGVLETQLVEAVSYYEESVDSLYELLLPTSEGRSGNAAMQESLENMAQVVAARTGAAASAVFLVEEFEEALGVRAVHGAFVPPFKLPDNLPLTQEQVSSYLKHAHFRLGEGLLGEVAAVGRPLMVPEADIDPRVPRNGDEAWLKLSSLMAVPLLVRDRIIGVLALERFSGEAFSESDFDRAKLLANFGSIAIANSFAFLEASERSDIEREAALAEGMQKTLLPSKLPPLGGFTFGAATVPARGVCSDYYDVIQTKADRAVLAVGDVAGKGVAAGIVMVMVSSILRLVTNSTKDMATLMAWVNRGIAGQVDLDHFATLGLVALDASTGALEFSNANQQPLLIYRADSQGIETVDLKSIPIGVEKTTAYGAKRLKLHNGDVLIMYTDGIVEAMNDQGKQFGRKNLASALLRCRDLPAKEVADAILGEVKDFSGRTRQHDDETVLVVKAKL